MKRLMTATLITALIAPSASFACSRSTGDRVHFLWGTHNSNYNVKSGYISNSGSSSSKVDFDYCDGGKCSEWINNCSLYYSKSAAVKRRDELDASHTSVGEAAGAAALLGLGALLFCGATGEC